MIQMKPYNEDTHVMVEHELREIIMGHIEVWLQSSDTNILTAKTLLRIVLKLLHNYHELYHTVCSIQRLEQFSLQCSD